MTATVIPHEHLRERREIRRLEEAVKANNIPRIGLISTSSISPTVADARAWNPESSYFVSTRSQIRTQFEGAEIENPTKPMRPLWKDIVAALFLVAFIYECTVLLGAALS